MTTPSHPKKLIEVALPLDDINAARAVIFSQMVDDPSAYVDELLADPATRRKAEQVHKARLQRWAARRDELERGRLAGAENLPAPGPEPGLAGVAAELERERLFDLIRELVLWQNTTNEEVLSKARAEIRRSWQRTCAAHADHPQAAALFNPDKLPAFHDPFAGGGALPLEAQRLGLEAYASDLNPVAVLINKAMIEIPPKFAGRPPVNPEKREVRREEREVRKEKDGGAHADLTSHSSLLFPREWRGAEGLADDVRYYGQWMRDRAEERIGRLYPKVKVTPEMVAERPDLKPYQGRELTVIAWLWARTVKSPNPAFARVDVPLASTFMLSTKKGKEAYVEPVIAGDGYRFTVKVGKPKDADAAKRGTKAGGSHSSFLCLYSGAPMSFEYLREQSKTVGLGSRLMAIVAEGDRGRVYLSPTLEHEAIARQAQPDWKPDVSISHWPGRTNVVEYGLTTFGDLFTPRQLVALTTFSDLVQEARAQAYADALGARASRPQKTWHSRGYLPHWEAGERPQHITFRLADSLPAALRAQWTSELAHLAHDAQSLERRKRIEAALDAGHGACWLARPDIAALVENALLHFDGTRYRLHAWTVMPNHVHVLVTPLHGNSLSSILHSWKSFTAKEANRALERSGAFWQEEYFDRMIRDDRHFAAAVRYIEENPVAAGLCAAAADWEWGSADAGEEKRAGRSRSQDEIGLDAGGTGAQAYADAVGVYLAFGVDKMSDRHSTLGRWDPTPTASGIINTFSRQALPMTWDYAEANPFSSASGNFEGGLVWIAKVIDMSIYGKGQGTAEQADASVQTISIHKLISTDPPYYDNIGYADLSDYFYVWMRRALRPTFPTLFATMAVPKAEELVATPYRHGSKIEAEAFFLDGMTQAMQRLAEQAHPAFPVTIYYAFKQAETQSNGTASTGWETFLDAVIRAGFAVSGTWPMRTELSNRMIGSGTNALASSIVLVCRRRADDAPTATRREFVATLKAELPAALAHLQRGNIAPVDLAQAAIGPGMAVFTRFARVLDASGRPMSVREALALINDVLDATLAEQEGDFDADTRWALAWFEQSGFDAGDYGVAETLSKAKNTSVAGMVEAGILQSGRGKVRLLKPRELPADWDPAADKRLTAWETVHHLIRVLETGGEEATAALVAALGSQAEVARELAYRLYTISERKKRAPEALAYNSLVQSWTEIGRLAQTAGKTEVQLGMEF